MSSVPPWWRSRRKRKDVRLSLSSTREARAVGVRQCRAPKPFASCFDQPQPLRRISLVFEENETARTQEFVLRWSSDRGSSVEEIVGQQWNFSPPVSIREVEEYQVQLSGVSVL